MRVAIFLCCLHLVVSQAVPRKVPDPRKSAVPRLNVPPPNFGAKAEFKLPDGIRYSKSSARANPLKNPDHVPRYLPFSENAEGVPQLSIKNIRHNLEKPSKQPDNVVKQNMLPNLDGLNMEQIRQKYGPSGNKPKPKAKIPPQGMDKHQALPKSAVGNRMAKDEH